MSMQAPTSDRVRLNVGGTLFETTAATLSIGGKTYFSSLLEHGPTHETIFIDRDPEPFRPILSYLRTGKLIIPPGVSEEAVRNEAEYYCVQIPTCSIDSRASRRGAAAAGRGFFAREW